MEAFSRDNPTRLKFMRRKDREQQERPVNELLGKANKLTGKARTAVVQQVSFPIPADLQAEINRRQKGHVQVLTAKDNPNRKPVP